MSLTSHSSKDHLPKSFGSVAKPDMARLRQRGGDRGSERTQAERLRQLTAPADRATRSRVSKRRRGGADARGGVEHRG
eukprot:scaffold62721_cov29-Tisochrysis_lutea.AAC.1